MKLRFQLGAWLCGTGISALLLTSGAHAQNRPPERPPVRQQQAPPRDANRAPRTERPAPAYHPQVSRPPSSRVNENRQPRYQDGGSPRNNNRPQGNAPRPYDNRGNNQNGRNDRPQSHYRAQSPAVPPPNVQERLRNMSPQDRNRLVENQRKFNQLPPQKQEDMRQAAANWQRLTPEQRNHLQNDVMPRWQQLAPDRQRAIRQRLGVLQNMPESARNRHLNDPAFTRGMTEDDRQMLQDLSHEHVGAPDQAQQ